MNQQQFYKSKDWIAFRKVIIEQRTDSDGFVRCAICGKPIVNKYDLIVHHKTELNDINCNDANIALNPDNVECVHFKCHNQIHDRWQGGNNGWRPPTKKVHIVYGPPCGGKSSWVNNVAGKRDLIVDMDKIWQCVTVDGEKRCEKPDALKSVVFDIRDKMYDIIKYRSGKWWNAYIITGGAMKGDRDRLVNRVGADDCILIDTQKDICIERVEEKYIDKEVREKYIEYIERWFEQYQSD